MSLRDEDSDFANVEPELDIESLSPEDRKKFLDAVTSGADSVELDAVVHTAPVAEAPISTPAPVVAPGAEATPLKEKPKTYLEAMSKLNTETQKREARDRLLKKIGTDPTFAMQFLHERGIPVILGQDPIVEACKVERVENVENLHTEASIREHSDSVNLAISHADTVLSDYDTGLGESLSQADQKWQAVHAELGGDETLLQQYLSDPEFRKTVKAQGPADATKYLATSNAVRKWMADHNTPLQKYLDFHDIPRKTPGTPAKAVQASPAIAPLNVANAEAQRLAAKQEEPQTLPNATGGTSADTYVAVQDLLNKADRIGVDNLTPAEKDRIHQFYA